jgi:hypothetical protein
MPSFYPFFRELFQTFLGDYLRLVEPDFAVHLLPEQARFPVLDLPDWTDEERSALGTVAEVPSRLGDPITVLVQAEPEPDNPADTARQLGRCLLTLERRLARPVFLSVVYLRGGRPGVNLETGAASRIFGMEVLRLFYTAFGLAESRAEYYLERPEPLAWALAGLMRPVRRSRAEHRQACLRRIAGASLPARERELLTACVEEWMELRPEDRAELLALRARKQNPEALFP